MKKVMKKLKQTLSILLAVTMIVGVVPQAGFAVAAAELDNIEQTGESYDDALMDDVQNEDVADVPETEDPGEVVPEEPAAEQEEPAAEPEVPEGEETLVPEVEDETELIPVNAEVAVTVAAEGDNAAQITGIQYAVGDAEFQNYTEAVNVEENAIFKLKFTVAEGYTATVKAGETELKLEGEGENACYQHTVTEATKITITAVQNETPAPETVTRTVTFEKNEKVQISDVKIGTEAKELTEEGTLEVTTEKDTAAAKIFFKAALAADSKYKIAKVEAVPAEGDVKELQAEGEVYSLDVDQDYTIRITTALDETKCNTLTIKAAEDTEVSWSYELVGKAEEDVDDGKGNITAVSDKLSVRFAPDAGYEIDKVMSTVGAAEAVELKPGEDGAYEVTFTADAKAVALTVSFKESAATVNKVTVAGVKNGAVTQTAGTRKGYKLTFDPKTTDFSKVGVAIVDKEGQPVQQANLKGASAEITFNTLYITAPVSAEDVWVKLYLLSDAEQKALDGGLIQVTPAKQLNTTVKPTAKVKFVSVSDTTLTLGVPKTVADPAVGKLYYQIAVTGGKTYFVEKKAGAVSQDETVTVKTWGENDTPVATDFEVKVTLVQVAEAIAADKLNDDGSLKDGQTVEAYDSSAEAAVTDKTRVLYYEDNLKLKKLTTKVYHPGENLDQKSVAVAEVQFNRNTSQVRLEAKDLSFGNNNKLDVDVINGVVMVSTKAGDKTQGKGTRLGKHTIQVTAQVDDAGELYASRATIVVEVVAGLEGAEVRLPSVSMYKADKKAATMKPTVFCWDNWDNTLKPKTTKWEILGANGKDVLTGTLRAAVSINEKNGTITVDKDYVPAQTEARNQFTVKVTVTDAGGNETSAVSDVITVSKVAQEPKAVVIARENADSYEIIVKDGGKTPMSVVPAQIQDAYVYALSIPVDEVKDSYTEEEWNKLVLNKDCFSFTSSNKKAVEIYDDGTGITVNVLKPAKNVTINAAANDGGKKKCALKFTVDYAKTGTLGLAVIDENGTALQVLPETGGEFKFNNSTDTRFLLHVVEKNENGEWVDLSDHQNFTVAVSGAKKSAVQTIEYWNFQSPYAGEYTEIVANGAKATVKITDKSVKPTKTTIFTLENTAYADANKGAAPKVTLVKPNDTLSTNAYEQTVKLSLKDGKNALTNEDGTIFVKAEADWTAVNAKNRSNYEDLVEAGSLIGWRQLKKDGTLDLTFTDYIASGSYKLKLMVGTINADGEFVPNRKPASVTVKCAVPKNTNSFKPATSYTMSAKESSVALSGSGKNVESVTITRLYNANIKGQMNAFRNYFEVKDGKIAFKSDLTAAQISAIEKDNLIGHADYTVKYTDGVRVSSTVKFTIKIKADAVLKYATINPTVLAAAEAQGTVTADVTVTANKAPVNVAYAVAEKVGETPFALANNKGNVQLTAVNPSVGSHKFTLYVVPEGSHEAGLLAAKEAKGETVTADDIKAAGVKVNVTVTVKKLDEKNLVKAAAKDLKKVFTPENYDKATGKYFVYVPVTKQVPGDITKSAEDKSGFDIQGLTDVDGRVWLKISVDRAGLEKISDNSKKPTSVDVLVKVGAGTVDSKLALKLSKEGVFTAEADNDYAKIAAAVTAAKAEIEKAVILPAYDAEDADGWKEAAVEALESVLAEYVPADSCVEVTFAAGALTAPESAKAGSLVVTATLTNAAATEGDTAPKTTEVEFTLEIPATGATAADMDNAVGEFISEKATGWATNETTIGDVATALREEIELESHLRIAVTDFEKSVATDLAAGSVEGKIRVYSILSEDEKSTSFSFEIVKLDNLDDTATKITQAVAKVDIGNAEVRDTAALKTNLDEVIAAAIVNKDVTYTWKPLEEGKEDVLAVEFATEEKAGSVKGTIVLTNPNTAGNDKEAKKEVEISITLAQLREATAVVTAVTDAAGSAKAADLAKSNVEADVKAAVLKAANDAVKHDPYVVKYAQEEGKDLFAFKAVTYKEGGEISYTLKVFKVAEDGTETAVENGEIKVETVTLAADPTLETLEEAQAEVKAVNFATTNETTAEEIVTAAQAGITKDSGITVAVKKSGEKDVFELIKATVKTPGSIQTTLVLTKGEETAEVELSLSIAVLAQTLSEATTAVKTEVEKLEVLNSDLEGEAKTAKEAEILEAAKAVVAEKYIVAVKENAGLTSTKEATLNEDGTATITLTVTDTTSTEQSNTADAACTLKVVVPQTLHEAGEAVAKVLETFKAENTTTEQAILSEAGKVIKTSDFEVEFGKEEEEKFKLVEATKDAAGSVTGRLVISEKAEGGKKVVVPVNLVIEQLQESGV